MFLTPDEIKELTKRTRYGAQAEMLQGLGIVHKIRNDGSLIVLRTHVEQQLGATVTVKAVKKSAGPNWDAAVSVGTRHAKAA